MFAVGVGTNVDEDELKEIATSPDYVLTSNSFTALQTIAPQIRKAVCDGEGDSLSFCCYIVKLFYTLLGMMS